MKKVMLVSGLFIFLGLGLVSCKKDYNCKCDKTYTSGSGTTTRDYSEYTYKDTRTRAEDRCNKNTDSGTDLGGNYAINCAIK